MIQTMENETQTIEQPRKNDTRAKNLQKALAKSIRETRENLQLSQLELAMKAGLCRSYISDVERGARSISLSNLTYLAGALEMDVWQLVQVAEQRQQ